MKKNWQSYRPGSFYDELINENGQPRPVSRRLVNQLQKISDDDMAMRRSAFDIIPRPIPAKEWQTISAGLIQRTRALNCFINDIYNEQKILADGVVPADIVLNSPNYKKQCRGIKPPFGVWAHICGTDLVRNSDGKFYVLEDNLRVPSGVSYMLENREITKRVLPDIFENHNILPVDDYPSKLYTMLASLSPRQRKRPCIVVLTPGIYNSAYFEHAFLAQGMGAQLVEGSDLFVSEDDIVYMRTVDGRERVDVIYRRIDDEFLDPEEFRKDSALGVPGVVRAWKAGNVAIANAPGSGVADDKVVYAFVPDMIRYYLKEEPLVNNVKTYLCMNKEDREYVIANIEKLVVKPANESGGYGLLVGPKATKSQHREFIKLINKEPRNYVAQPTLSLSTAPIYVDGKVEPRHLDLRPFILQARKSWVTPGGLTRVALVKGSLVVNSSQGGGSKDTWIVE